jgi:drug/metabolite transporter (DMT)-like permease
MECLKERRIKLSKWLSTWVERIQQKPYLLLVIAAFLWGSNFVFGRLLVQTIPPFHLSIMRWIVGFLVFFPLAWKEIIINKEILLKNWKIIFFLALTGIAGFNSLLYVAVQYTTSINATLVNATAPLLIVILSVLFLNEKLVWIQYIGIAISFLGVLWIFVEGSIENLLALSFNLGDLFVIAAVISWSIYSILMKKWGGNLPRKSTFLSTIFLGILILVPFWLWEELHSSFAIKDLTTVDWLGIVYLGTFPSIVAMVCWNEGVMQVGPGRASNFLYLIIFFGGIMAVLVGEQYTLVQFTGGLLILTGVILASNPELIKRVFSRASIIKSGND